ncbi:MarR family transcriptional regulator [Vulcanimicrobium alpinum]|uniref:MarR family transcriptional regulator n=1 Tax=Vulcanimicrobium alpinum TaxID=3016050 RepID=A0AAN1XYP9_UNVUL|nr:MarR family transcriptional regulator [Vulcanimicrobium alpinum]BDE07404.1 MarR family transcriptional regulator [Vulcanimicrobium alpinum]
MKKAVSLTDAVGFHLDPQRSFGYLLREASRTMMRALGDRIERHDVTLGQYFILRELWEEDGLTQRELSTRIGILEPSTVAALDAMEKRGLIERRRSVEDRRKTHIMLTPKSKRLRTVLLRYAAEVNALALKGVSSAQIRQVREVLQRVRANLTAHPEE